MIRRILSPLSRGLVAAILSASFAIAGDREGSNAFPEIREVPVPVEKIGERLRSPGRGAEHDWQPIRRSDYEALLRAAQPPPPEPEKAWIELAEYSATFDSQTLRGGTLTAEVRRTGSQAVLALLDPLNLAVSRLDWPNEQAVWGTTPNGRTALLVDGKHAELTGQWTLKGRRLPHSVEFDVQVAPATVSRLVLRVPDGYTVRSSAGHVAPTQPAKQAGWSTWRIDLGSQAGCRLTIGQEQEQAPREQPLLLTNSDLSYVVSQEGLQVQADFQLEVVRAAVERLRFLLPADMQVTSVTYGADTALGTRSVVQGGAQRLDVELPDPLLGLSRTIRILGIAPAKLERQWALPHTTLQNAGQMTGTLNLKVETPLVVRSFEASGYRQTAMLADRNQAETFTFQQFAPNARLVVLVDYPRSVLSARVVTHINASTETWELASEVQWEARAGSTFEARCSLPPKWKITNVRAAPDSSGSEIANWEVVRGKGGRRHLVLEFMQPLDPETPKRVHVLAQRLSTPARRKVSLPVLEPLDSGDVEILLAVSHSPRTVPVLVSGSSLKELAADQLPEFGQQSPLLKEVQAGEKGPRLFLYGNTTARAGDLYFKSSNPPVTADIQVTLDVDSNQLSESYLVRLRTIDAPVDRVFIYLSSSGPAIAWELLGKAKGGKGARQRLSAERIPPNRYGQWNIPRQGAGELWEVALPSPQEGEFLIAASRAQTPAATEKVPLAFVPRSQRFRGIIELRVNEDVEADVQADGPRPVDAAAADQLIAEARPPGAARLWTYHEMSDRLTLHFPAENIPARTGPLALLELQSLISAARSGSDIHRARYEIDEHSNRGQFRFSLKPPAELIEVLINSQPVTPSRQEKRYLLPPLPGPGASVVEIRYRTPSDPGFVRGDRKIVVPQTTTHTILSFLWEFAVPPELAIAAEPGSVSLSESLPELSAMKRLFGPLGRSGDEVMFNPFLRNSWRELFHGGSGLRSTARHTSEPAVPDDTVASADSESLTDTVFPPAGWRVWRATAPNAPATVTLETWNRPRAELSAWIGLLGCVLIGFLLRLAGVLNRAYVAAYWLALCITASWLAPPVYAEIAGGCLAGTIIAILLPRSMLFRLTLMSRDEQGISVGSTVSVREPAATALLIGLTLLAASGTAQESKPQPTSRKPSSAAFVSPHSTPNHFDVLIPIGSELRPSEQSPLVYLPRKLTARLQQLARERRQAVEYLISSADYGCTIDGRDSIAVAAEYKIAVLSAKATTRVRLPIRDANLAEPNECLVNGKPQPVLRSRDNNDFIIELTRDSLESPRMGAEKPKDEDGEPGGVSATLAPQLFDIRLRLLSPVTADGGSDGGTLMMGIPAVAASRLTLEFDRWYPTFDVKGTRGAIKRSKDAGATTISLGMTGRFEVAWSADEQPTEEPALMQAEIACLVEAYPTRLEFHYRVTHHVLRGSVDFVTWQIPRGMVLRKVVAEELIGTPSVTRSASHSPRLLIEFSAPQTGDLVVDASFTMPIRSAGKVVRVPAVKLFGPDVQVTQNQLAVSTTSGFRANVPAGSTGRPAAVTVIDQSLKDWARELEAREPELAFQLSRPAELQLQLVPLAPQRTVEMKNQVGRIGKTKLLWTLTAEVRTTAPGTFQHTLTVDPRLTIDSITVEEDGAPRLIRWSRNADRVILFLSGKPNDIQDVALTATMPLQPATVFDLPSIRFEDADLEDSNLLLVHEPDVAVRLIPSGAIETDEEPLGRPSENGDEIVLGPFRLSGNGKLPRIRVESHSEHVRADSLAVVEQRTGDRWNFSTSVRFHDFTQSESQLQVRIPAELARDCLVEPDGTREMSPDGSAIVTFEPEQPVSEDFLVTVTARLLEVPDTGRWELPTASAVDAGRGEHHLLVSPPEAMRPVNAPVQPVEKSSLPDWISRANSIGSETETWASYQSGKQPWVLVRQPADDGEQRTRVPLADTRIWLSRNAAEFGESTFFIVSNGERSIDLSWPRDCLLRGLVVDGKATTSLLPSSGKLAVPLDTLRPTHRVDVCWSHDPDSSMPRFGSHSEICPQPRQIKVQRSMLTLVPPPDIQCVMRDGFTKIDQVDHSLSRLEGLLDASDVHLTETGDDDVAWNALAQEYELVTRLLAGASAAGLSWSDEQRQRFARISRNVRELRQTTDSSTPGAALPASMTSFGGQRPRECPNRSPLHGQVHTAESAPVLSVWIIDDLFITWGLAFICLFVAAPVAHWSAKAQLGRYIEAHQPVSWALLGLVWWMCFSAGIIGMLLLLLAAIQAVRHNRQVAKQQDFVVQDSASSQ